MLSLASGFIRAVAEIGAGGDEDDKASGIGEAAEGLAMDRKVNGDGVEEIDENDSFVGDRRGSASSNDEADGAKDSESSKHENGEESDDDYENERDEEGRPPFFVDDEDDFSSVSVLSALSSLRRRSGAGAEVSSPSYLEYVAKNFPGDTKFLGELAQNGQPLRGTLVAPDYTFRGTFWDGLYHGPDCSLVKSDGTSYEGEFRLGLYHGAGKLIETVTVKDSSNKDDEEMIYTGEFVEGKRHGTGLQLIRPALGKTVPRHINQDAGCESTYSGQWAYGEKDGEGVEQLADGEMYSGRYCKGRRHGPGMLTSPNGTVHKGTWTGGSTKNGPGWKVSYPDGRTYEGCCSAGEPHGLGTMHYPSSSSRSYLGTGGAVYKGEFRQGRRHGKGILVLDDMEGETINGLWADNKPVGMGLGDLTRDESTESLEDIGGMADIDLECEGDSLEN